MSKDTKWWEFYVVRYTMGTIVGAIVIIVLSRDGGLLGSLFKAPEIKEFGWDNIIVFGALGLTYCYISSIPVLVFHAARFKLSPTTGLPGAGGWLFIAITAVVFAVVFGWAYGADVKLRVVAASLGLIIGFVLAATYFAVIVLLRYGEEQYAFYKRLSKRRKNAGDIVDSYRHLREHGNSVFIVVLELVFGAGLALFSGKVEQWTGHPAAASTLLQWLSLLAFVVLWIVPGAYVWSSATAFERRFADDEREEPS